MRHPKDKPSLTEIIDKQGKRIDQMREAFSTHLDIINALMLVCIKNGLRDEAITAVKNSRTNPPTMADLDEIERKTDDEERNG